VSTQPISEATARQRAALDSGERGELRVGRVIRNVTCSGALPTDGGWGALLSHDNEGFVLEPQAAVSQHDVGGGVEVVTFF
jgi:hypothetical protein